MAEQQGPDRRTDHEPEYHPESQRPSQQSSTQESPFQEQPPPRRLTRSHDSKLGGVAAGIAEYFDFDPTLVRVGFIVLLLFPMFPFFGGIVLYFLLWLVMPGPSASTAGDLRGAAAPADRARGGRGVDGTLLIGIALVALGLALFFPLAVGAFVTGWPAPMWPGWWMPRMMDFTWAFAPFAWPVLLMLIGGVLLIIALGRRT